MKTAIYIEDGIVQLVITPETEFERNALSSFQEKPLGVKLFAGSFYDCRGGWVRQSDYYPSHAVQRNEDRSLILTIRPEKPEVVAHGAGVTSARETP
jgi:hypothetical protein